MKMLGPMHEPIANLKGNLLDASGMNVIVTGGYRGIGFGIAEAFAQRGANVAILDLTEEMAAEAAKRLEENGGKYIGLACQVQDHAACREAVKKVHDVFGRIDVLVNNAGVAEVKAFLDQDENLTEFNKMIGVDLLGAAYMIYEVGQFMRSDQNGGSIINISSVGGERCDGARVMPVMGYNVAKAGINMMTHALAGELAQYNIRVNCIAPGPTHTGLDDKMPPERMKEVTRTVLTRRHAQPIELGALAVFLACEEGQQITGSILNHDGGRRWG